MESDAMKALGLAEMLGLFTRQGNEPQAQEGMTRPAYLQKLAVLFEEWKKEYPFKVGDFVQNKKKCPCGYKDYGPYIVVDPNVKNEIYGRERGEVHSNLQESVRVGTYKEGNFVTYLMAPQALEPCDGISSEEL